MYISIKKKIYIYIYIYTHMYTYSQPITTCPQCMQYAINAMRSMHATNNNMLSMHAINTMRSTHTTNDTINVFNTIKTSLIYRQSKWLIYSQYQPCTSRDRHPKAWLEMGDCGLTTHHHFPPLRPLLLQGVMVSQKAQCVLVTRSTRSSRVRPKWFKLTSS